MLIYTFICESCVSPNQLQLNAGCFPYIIYFTPKVGGKKRKIDRKIRKTTKNNENRAGIQQYIIIDIDMHKYRPPYQF